jgi:alkylation response protein AidB-like acyl-CoA dehydrogenase
MDFELSHEQLTLRDSIRRFMKQEVLPVVDKHDRERSFPFELLKELQPFGYLGGFLPEAQGGMDIDPVTWTMMMEEAGYHWSSLRTLLNTTNMPMLMLAGNATPAQRERFLAPLFRGERQVFSAITEPNTGSNVAAVQTRADRKGDHYVLNGRKLWITNGAWGDFGIVLARTFSPDCEGKLSLFIVEREVSPYDVRHVELMTLRSTGTAELGFTDVVVPAENLLGREGDALRLVLAGLDPGRLNVAAGAVGAARRALDLSIEYAQTRQQFGKPIGSFQLIQKHIVDMRVRVDAGQALCLRAAKAMAAGKARMECSIAKLYATESAHEVANMALQVHGGQGYAEGFPIERIFRDTRGGMIPEGTTEIQTLIIGRELLGLSAIA